MPFNSTQHNARKTRVLALEQCVDAIERRISLLKDLEYFDKSVYHIMEDVKQTLNFRMRRAQARVDYDELR